MSPQAIISCLIMIQPLLLTCLSCHQVRNGSSASAPLLGKFCGSTLPNPVFPMSNLLFLRFKSDVSQARNGFEITWTSSPQGTLQ